jgi:hypothetical protein
VAGFFALMLPKPCCPGVGGGGCWPEGTEGKGEIATTETALASADAADLEF